MPLTMKGVGIAAALVAAGLFGLTEPAAARGILVTDAPTIEVRVNGERVVRSVGSDIEVGDEVETLRTPAGAAFPDGALLVVSSGSTFRVDEYRTGADPALTISLGPGRFHFRSGNKFPAEAYALTTLGAEPIRLQGTEVCMDQPEPGQIALELEDGSITFGDQTFTPADGAILLTYQIIGGRMVIVDQQPTDSVCAQMRPITIALQSFLGAPGGPPINLLAELGLPSEVIEIIMAAAENPLQASPR